MEVQQITKISLAWELCEAGVPKTHIAERVGVNRDTVRLWVKGISSAPEGLIGFLDSYKRAKKGPRAKRKLDGLLKKRIYRIKEEKRIAAVKKFRSTFGMSIKFICLLRLFTKY